MYYYIINILSDFKYVYNLHTRPSKKRGNNLLQLPTSGGPNGKTNLIYFKNNE